MVFVGGRSASDARINARVRALIAAGYPIRWNESANDSEVTQIITESDFFLSVGTEGYGIPVLEAIALGTPVLYSGIQPAAELMEGMGSHRVGVESGSLVNQLEQMFITNSTVEKVNELMTSINSDSVPKWSEFAAHVVLAVRRLVG